MTRNLWKTLSLVTITLCIQLVGSPVYAITYSLFKLQTTADSRVPGQEFVVSTGDLSFLTDSSDPESVIFDVRTTGELINSGLFDSNEPFASTRADFQIRVDATQASFSYLGNGVLESDAANTTYQSMFRHDGFVPDGGFDIDSTIVRGDPLREQRRLIRDSYLTTRTIEPETMVQMFSRIELFTFGINSYGMADFGSTLELTATVRDGVLLTDENGQPFEVVSGPVPEPVTMSLFGGGFIASWVLRRKKQILV